MAASNGNPSGQIHHYYYHHHQQQQQKQHLCSKVFFCRRVDLKHSATKNYELFNGSATVTALAFWHF